MNLSGGNLQAALQLLQQIAQRTLLRAIYRFIYSVVIYENLLLPLREIMGHLFIRRQRGNADYLDADTVLV